MTPANNSARFYHKLYAIYLPAAFTTLVFVVPPFFVNRRLFGDSFVVDLVARGLICLWWAVAYRRMLTLPTQSAIYPNIAWKEQDVVSAAERIFLKTVALVFGFGTGLIPFWIFTTFLPFLGYVNWVLAGVNGGLITVPVFRHYYTLKF